jgi:hypothetical protein
MLDYFAYQLIDAAEVVPNLSPIWNKPTHESQIQPPADPEPKTPAAIPRDARDVRRVLPRAVEHEPEAGVLASGYRTFAQGSWVFNLPPAKLIDVIGGVRLPSAISADRKWKWYLQASRSFQLCLNGGREGPQRRDFFGSAFALRVVADHRHQQSKILRQMTVSPSSESGGCGRETRSPVILLRSDRTADSTKPRTEDVTVKAHSIPFVPTVSHMRRRA